MFTLSKNWSSRSREAHVQMITHQVKMCPSFAQAKVKSSFGYLFDASLIRSGKAGQPLEAMTFELSHERFQQKEEKNILSTENMSQSRGGKRRAF